MVSPVGFYMIGRLEWLLYQETSSKSDWNGTCLSYNCKSSTYSSTEAILIEKKVLENEVVRKELKDQLTEIVNDILAEAHLKR